jgi:tetratricopeptide (TPR) repeat protein
MYMFSSITEFPRRLLPWVISAIVLVALAACTSPEEKALNFYERGMELLDDGQIIKARLEFQNALQIKNDLAPAWYGLALIAERNAEWKKLFSLLKKVVELEPAHIDAQIKLGKLMLSAGQLDKALEVSDITMLLDKSRSDVLALRSAVLFRLDDKESASKYAQSSLDLDADNQDALLVMASIKLFAGDSKSAVMYMDRGLASNEKNVAMQLIKIQALESMTRLEDAEVVYQRLIELFPGTREFRHLLAQFYISQERNEEALKIYQAIVLENPADLKAKIEFVKFTRAIQGDRKAVELLKSYINAVPGNIELRFVLANLYQAMSDEKSADQVYQTIVDTAGDNTAGIRAKGLLAASYLKKGKLEESQALIEEILSADTRNEQALTLKSSIAIKEGRTDQAIADLRTILRDVPDSARTRLLLAQAYSMGGLPELALDQYQRAYAIARHKIYGLAYSQFLLKHKKASKAEDILKEMDSRYPSDISILKLLALAHLNQGEWVEAEVLADRITQLGDSSSASEQILGAIHSGKQEYDQSIEAFRKAYAVAPGQAQPLIALVRSYVYAQRSEEAARFLDNVLNASPNNAVAHMLMGQVALLQGNQDLAEQSFRSVIKLDAGNTAAFVTLSNYYIKQGRLADAEVVVNQGLSDNQNDLGLLLSRAAIYELSGQYEKAIRQYDDILGLRPQSDIVANNLASLLSDHRSDKASYARAYELAQRFRTSEVPHFQDTLGWASYRAGNLDEGLRFVSRATTGSPDTPIFHYHLGIIQLALNKTEDGKIALEKALELAGDQDEIVRDAAKVLLEGL